MKHLSRRQFGALVIIGAVSGCVAAPFKFGASMKTTVTADDVVERIKRNIGVEWRAETIDGFKAGDPSTPVTGVVTTAMATMDVLQQAVEAGANLVITCEPTFFGRSDARIPPAGNGAGAGSTAPPDPVYAAKNQFIDAHGLVIFRLSDHWRLRSPDPFEQGLAEVLEFALHQVSNEPLRYEVPPVTLDAFASDIKRRLAARGGIRVVGDPQTRVRSVALLPGSTPLDASLEAFPAADVVVAGEVREWESVEYVRDLILAGQPKGLILVGRVVSEEPGMALCANWLETLVQEVPVMHVSAGDPYWRPAS